ncbi:hypothetical protein [Denitrificimonas caeni]|uniref:Uncharacterized protein n=1 Tax=Denitrificimonas caeni TaxID=521720 RepID=A0AAF0AK89_9GAMM|nr:hypothetical protein [Denitrificimonas caeni]WBE26245.1 hypothetical protein O6P33_05285 [Denitrificimonas caeni]
MGFKKKADEWLAKNNGLTTLVFLGLIVVPIIWLFATQERSSQAVQTEQVAPVTPAPAAMKNWRFNETIDPMTDKKTQTLKLKSINSTAFDFPYNTEGGSYLYIVFRKKGNSFDAYMSIDKGQMICGVNNCKFSLRVGDSEVQTWTGLQSSTYDSDLMFIRDARSFEKIVQRGEPIRIGIEFYEAGVRVFEFDVTDYTGF